MNVEEMDKECVNLCNAINKIPGLSTFESCCGHEKHKSLVLKMEAKVDLLIWSGGLDSTAILLSYIRQGKDLKTMYIEIANNENKVVFEESRRNTIKAITQQNYDDKIIVSPNLIDNVNGTVINQSFMWLTSLFLGLDRNIEYENILFGYIKGDDFWHSSYDFKMAFKYLWKLNCGTKKMPNLLFPLEWLNKKEIIDYYYLQDSLGREVFKYIWTCEMPKVVDGCYDACGNCHSCEIFEPLKEYFSSCCIDKIKVNINKEK